MDNYKKDMTAKGDGFASIHQMRNCKRAIIQKFAFLQEGTFFLKNEKSDIFNSLVRPWNGTSFLMKT